MAICQIFPTFAHKTRTSRATKNLMQQTTSPHHMQETPKASRGTLSVWSHAMWWILLMQPFVFLAVIPLLPTFDDWKYLTKPQLGAFDPSLLLPWNTYWRPFDGLMGYIVGRNLALFPTLNHVLILTGHLLNTFILWGIARKVHLGRLATNITLLFFYFSPAMLATVLDIDSMNQTFALMWGLLCVYMAMSHVSLRRIGMGLTLLLSILCKENGLCFILVIPLLLYFLHFQTRRQVLHEFLFLATVGVLYLIVRFCLPQHQADLGGVYFDGGSIQYVRNIGMYIAFTWIPVDFVSVLHAPSRNVLLAGLTFVLGIPFYVALFLHQQQQTTSKWFVGLQLCALTAAAMHLMTIFTVMHAYAGLAFTALSLGYLAQHTPHAKALRITFALWLLSTLITDTHHVQKAYESGMTGKRMAEQALAHTPYGVQKVRLIMVEDGYPRYSMFCVIPYEAFGWGIAAQYANDYVWPQQVDCMYVEERDTLNIPSLAQEAYAQGYECVWVARKDHVEVLKRKSEKDKLNKERE